MAVGAAVVGGGPAGLCAARALLQRGVRPVLLAYSLGKAQETIAQLTARGLRLCAHPSIHDITQLYGRLGVPLEARRFEGAFQEGEVGLFPPFRSRAI